MADSFIDSMRELEQTLEDAGRQEAWHAADSWSQSRMWLSDQQDRANKADFSGTTSLFSQVASVHHFYPLLKHIQLAFAIE